MTLKEALSADAVRRPDYRARTALEMLHHPRADALEILREVQFGDRPLSLIRPQDLIRPAQRHAHDDAAIGSGGRCPCGLGAMRGSRLGDVDLVGRRGRLGFDLLGRLVLAKPLERGLPDHACAGEPSKLDLSHQFGLQPMHPGLLARRILAAERIRLGCRSLELRHQARDLVGTVARSDVADVDQVIAAINAGHQRSELAAIAVPAADDHLVSGAALGLGPASPFVRKRNGRRLVSRRSLPVTSGRRI